MSVSSPSATSQPQSRPALRVNIRDFGTLLGLVLIVVVFALVAPGFLAERNLMNILQQ